jgi:Fe2+ transport system protein FeoA
MMNALNKVLRFRVLDERSGVGYGNARSLDTLRPGRAGRVVELSPECRGFERSRLMDLGLVPGSLVERSEQAPFGGPIAFRLRGVTLALRPAQASLVAVEEVM